MWHAFVRMSYLLTTYYLIVLLTTYYLIVLLPQSYFRKMGMTNACNDIRDILYNIDVITSVVKLFIVLLVSY